MEPERVFASVNVTQDTSVLSVSAAEAVQAIIRKVAVIIVFFIVVLLVVLC
jgi:hypothetical protein